MNEQDRFEAFIEQLTTLSKEYGIAIQTIGGVHIFENPKDAESIEYTQDHSSSDLMYCLTDQD